MLVLSRRREETIHIISPEGLTTIVKIVFVRGRQVGLGFEAPPKVKVLRGEQVEGGPKTERAA